LPAPRLARFRSNSVSTRYLIESNSHYEQIIAQCFSSAAGKNRDALEDVKIYRFYLCFDAFVH